MAYRPRLVYGCIVSADEVARLRDVIWSESVGPWIEDVGLPNGLRVLRPPGACVQLPRSFAVPAALERVSMAYVRTLCEHEDLLLDLFLTWKDTAWSRSSELACLLLRSGAKASAFILHMPAPGCEFQIVSIVDEQTERH